VLAWAAARCGRPTPAAAQAPMVSPEQSHESGPAAPNTYGSPSWASANWTALWATADPVITNPVGMVVVPATLLPVGPTIGPAPPPPAQIGGDDTLGAGEDRELDELVAVGPLAAAAAGQNCPTSCWASATLPE